VAYGLADVESRALVMSSDYLRSLFDWSAGCTQPPPPPPPPLSPRAEEPWAVPLFGNASACRIEALGECSRADRATVAAYVACLVGALLCCGLSRMLHARARARCCDADALARTVAEGEPLVTVEPSPHMVPPEDTTTMATATDVSMSVPNADTEDDAGGGPLRPRQRTEVGIAIATLPMMCESSQESLSSAASAASSPSFLAGRSTIGVEPSPAQAVPVSVHVDGGRSPPPAVPPLGGAGGLAGGLLASKVASATEIQLELSDEMHKPESPRVSFPSGNLKSDKSTASSTSDAPGGSARSDPPVAGTPPARLGALGLPTDITRRASSLTPRSGGGGGASLRRGSTGSGASPMNVSMRRLEHGASSLARQVSKSSLGRQVSGSACAAFAPNDHTLHTTAPSLTLSTMRSTHLQPTHHAPTTHLTPGEQQRARARQHGPPQLGVVQGLLSARRLRRRRRARRQRPRLLRRADHLREPKERQEPSGHR